MSDNEADRTVATSDEDYRRLAARLLAQQLERAGGLLDRCEAFARSRKGNGVEPLYAAARVLQANAQLGKSLAQVVQAERRVRTIVETIQKPDPKFVELNAQFEAENRRREADAARAKMEDRILEIVDRIRAKRERERAEEAQQAGMEAEEEDAQAEASASEAGAGD